MLRSAKQNLLMSFRSRSLTKTPFVAAGITYLLLSYSTVALASPDFPTALRDAAGLDCTPVCSVCHTTEPGTSGTASKAFALAMRDAGLEAGDANTVGPAFAVLDPDGDGVPEFEGTAGETETTDFPCQAEVQYGCGMASAPSPTKPSRSVHFLLVGLLALGISLRRRIFGSAPEASV
jgi:MYXO-CTERM domain-containing protein